MELTEGMRKEYLVKIANTCEKAYNIGAHWGVCGIKSVVEEGKLEFRTAYADEQWEMWTIADGWKKTYDKMKMECIVYVDGQMY